MRLWRMWRTYSLPSLPGPLWPEVVVPVRVPSLSQKEIFIIYSWNHLIMCKQMTAGKSRDKIISDVLLWTPSHGQAKAGQPARAYILQLCANTGCSLEDLLEVMDDREGWQEKVREIRAGGETWWWWHRSTWSYLTVCKWTNNV